MAQEKWQKQPMEHWLLQSVASEISIFFLFCLHRQLQIRSRKYAPRGMFVFCKRTLAWIGVNVLVQSVLAPFIACTAGYKSCKNSIEMEKKKNVGGKAKQKKTKSCIKQLISIDCIQLCKRCWDDRVGGTEVSAEQCGFSFFCPDKAYLWAFLSCSRITTWDKTKHPSTACWKLQNLRGCEHRTRAMGTGLSFASEPVPLGAWMCSTPASALKSPLWGRTPVHKPASLQVLYWRDVSNKQLLLTVIALELTRCLGGWWLLQPDSTPAALETSLLYLTTVLMPESFRGHSSLGITEK